jgi:hypothetical protein
VLELDPRTCGEVRRRTRTLDERGKTGDVVRLNMRLEHRHDR